MQRALWILAALVALGLPLLHLNDYLLQVIATAYITAIAVYGLNVILGYTGLLNLGHASFFGIGAYGVALLETKAGWPFWLALIASINLISPSMGFSVILKAFAIIVLGGMGSVPGAILGAFILAFAESFGGTYISSSYQDAIAFAVLVIILSVRPTGLFAKGT